MYNLYVEEKRKKEKENLHKKELEMKRYQKNIKVSKLYKIYFIIN